MKKFNFILSLIFATQTAFATVISDDKIELGKPGSTANKSILFQGGRNNTKPQIRYNTTGGTLEFSHNGSDFADIGSGSGGGSGGINLLKNGDFETAIGSTWTNSGGTFARVTSGSNLLFGKGSATFTPSSSGQYIQTALVTIPEGLGGQNCMAKISYKGGDATYLLKVLDSSSVLLGSKALPAAATLKQDTTLNFPCPAAAGQIRLRLESTASAPIIAVDNAHLGEASNLFQLSQAQFLGTLRYDAAVNCRWQLFNVSALAPFPADNDCPAPTTTGQVSAPSTKIPGFKLTNLMPGTYQIVATGHFRHYTASGNWTTWALSDTTTVSATQGVGGGSSSTSTAPVISGVFTYALPQAEKTFQVVAGANGGTQDAELYNEAGSNLEFQVYYFPSAALQGYIPDSPINWNAELSLTGGNYSLPLASNPPSVPPIPAVTAASKGSILAKVACSGIAPTGLSCAGNTEHFGIAVDVPVAGKVEVCAEFSVALQPGTGSGNVYNSFRISKTALDYSETELEASASMQAASMAGTTSSTLNEYPIHICGSFNANAGLNIFKVKNEVTASGVVFTRNNLILDSSTGTPKTSGRLTVRPLTQNQPAPVLIKKPTVVGRYGGTPSGTLAAAFNVATFPTVFEEFPSGSYSSGVWTCPEAGLYDIDASFSIINGGSVVAGEYVGIAIHKNSSTAVAAQTLRWVVPNGNGSQTNNTSVKGVRLAVGDTIDVRGITSVSGAFYSQLLTNAESHFSIIKVGE